MAHGGNAPVLPGTPVAAVSTLRRFSLADFSSHGHWMAKRLAARFPQLSDKQVFGWLNGLVYSPEYYFVCQENSVALAQCVKNFTLDPHPAVQEHFVFVQDRENDAHLEQAAEFYAEFIRWGQSKDADVILLSASSDVPEDMVKRAIGAKARVMQVQQTIIKWTDGGARGHPHA